MATLTSLTLSSTPAAAENNDTAIRPFRVTVPEKELVELRRRIAATRWPTKELVDGSVAGRAARDAQSARPLLGDRVRLAEGRGQAECLPAVRDEDRRRGHPLHPRQVASP